MISVNDLRRLGRLTGMMLDIRLADLQRAASLRDECATRLKGIQATTLPAEGLEGAASELAQLTYQRWVDLRREDLNRQLAQKTVDWLEAAEAARVAFGKDRALTDLALRAAGKR